MTGITPIETRYGGCRFRSRREARWAVFFDRLGIPWQYEPEGFDLGSAGAYLPDFLLYPDTEQSIWFEVKAQYPTDDEIRRVQALSALTRTRGFIYFADIRLPAPASLIGLTWDQYANHATNWHWDNKEGWSTRPDGPAPWQVDLAPTAYMFSGNNPSEPRTAPWWWTDCDVCGMVILKFEGQVGFCPDWYGPPDSRQVYPSFGHATPRLQAAYTAARSARFEFGERG